MTELVQETLVTAEVVTPYSRRPLTALHRLEAGYGRVAELVIPDGTVGLALGASLGAALVSVVLRTDQALHLTLGPTGSNQPVTLAPDGMLALLGTDLAAATAITVTYAPGTGVPAHLTLLGCGNGALTPPPEPPEPWQWVGRYHETFAYDIDLLLGEVILEEQVPT